DNVAAIGTMMGRDLPPTGNAIALTRAAVQPVQWPPGYRPVFVNSGTAALALALLLARLQHPEIVAPEAVLPGYACPDLVAAAEFAGLRAVLADIGESDPGYDLESLQRVLNANTVAVVAVNFLGIGERLRELRQLLQDWPQAALVEDNAQWFPEPLPTAELLGDSVCLSFGRGKPVSLLGGGALLLRETYFDAASTEGLIEPVAQHFSAWKARLYNYLLRPSLYGIISRNPLLHLGQTVFKPLSAVSAMDEQRQVLLATNIESYLARATDAAERIHAAVPPSKDLPAWLAARSARLLRYPLLCADLRERDVLLQQLRRAGLGATALYQRILPAVTGVDDRVEVRVPLDGARAFADRLLTLPVHAGVSMQDVRRMAAIIRMQ
ncbi:MAG TPA: DegT/DnrJ/EryC1/StrS family aminotransferase, partial [Spongiibacteraceae bacterium]|nr:DegT/DnrJ/EryC1/StrS family aminotransferase [Spongiibacteraceae bacterium]